MEKTMAKEIRNGLFPARLEGMAIMRADDQKCETCKQEWMDCHKLICSGGHVCVY